MSGRTRVAGKTVGALTLLTVALPANLIVTTVALLRSAVRPPPPSRVAERRRTVLINGGKMTKALVLCRSFHAAGHRVVLVESAKYRFTGHRFSRAVDAFHVVPEPHDPGYAQALLDVVRREQVDLFVPVSSPAGSRHDAVAGELLQGHCEVMHADADTVRLLDDKYEFARTAASLQLPMPETHRVTSADQVAEFEFDAAQGPYVLKNLAYDPVNRLDLTPLPRTTHERTTLFARSKPITPATPWILQSLMHGTEYCTHSTVRDGEVLVYVCCESSAFQLNYAPVDRPEIEKWVREFVEPLRLTGQISFDFIVDHTGVPRAIECNPRTHSAITLFGDDADLARAYLGELDGPALTPDASRRPTYWLYQELWRLLRDPRSAALRWRTVRGGRDAVFDTADPLPFLLVHHLQIPSLLLRNLVHGKDWTRIDFNIGKLVEPGGD